MRFRVVGLTLSLALFLAEYHAVALLNIFVVIKWQKEIFCQQVCFFVSCTFIWSFTVYWFLGLPINGPTSTTAADNGTTASFPTV